MGLKNMEKWGVNGFIWVRAIKSIRKRLTASHGNIVSIAIPYFLSTKS